MLQTLLIQGPLFHTPMQIQDSKIYRAAMIFQLEKHLSTHHQAQIHRSSCAELTPIQIAITAKIREIFQDKKSLLIVKVD